MCTHQSRQYAVAETSSNAVPLSDVVQSLLVPTRVDRAPWETGKAACSSVSEAINMSLLGLPGL